MPALNFSERFAAAVESGEKCQTIRKQRKNPIKVGDPLYLYTGMRTKQCRKLKETKCTGVYPVLIVYGGLMLCRSFCSTGYMKEIVRRDGFDNPDEFFEWFKDHYGLPFRGVLIRW